MSPWLIHCLSFQTIQFEMTHESFEMKHEWSTNFELSQHGSIFNPYQYAFISKLLYRSYIVPLTNHFEILDFQAFR